MMLVSRHSPLTSAVAAEILGVSPMRIRQLAQAGIIGTKVGTQWLFTAAELAAYKRDREPRLKKNRKDD